MNIGEMIFRVGDIHDAAELVQKFHYSARATRAVQVVGTWHVAGGLFGDRGSAVAACVFSIPPTRWSENVLELSRLVRAEDIPMPPLSGLIAQTLQFMRKAKRGDLLVSFADATQGHHGGIYQAASWNYAGKRDSRLDGLIIDGVFFPGRSCNNRWGTRSPTKLQSIIPHSVIKPHYDDGKHLYWKNITKKGERMAVRLGLEKLAYPKPSEMKPTFI